MVNYSQNGQLWSIMVNYGQDGQDIRHKIKVWNLKNYHQIERNIYFFSSNFRFGVPTKIFLDSPKSRLYKHDD